jgi:hypothetical protein
MESIVSRMRESIASVWWEEVEQFEKIRLQQYHLELEEKLLPVDPQFAAEH